MVVIPIFLLTFLLGPCGSIPFALASGMRPLETALLISAIHVALVPVWFGIMEVLKYGARYRNRLIQRALGYIGRKKVIEIGADAVRKFEHRVGQTGFGLGVVGFTFLFGVSWAALGACLLNLKEATIVASIAIGAALSSVFWTLVFSGLVVFLPWWMLYVPLTAATFGILAYKKIGEQELLRKFARRWYEESMRSLRAELRRVTRVARA